ncbi:Spx/MgsR family RNA polymerase-binding regulatory protein [Enterococcus faecium]|uniref:Spx/MgsR family RNA polymerase-binding regulatory protein n=1 Tax=Enterococcus faecium TaxID=1352 RepID=UPI000F508331|nr:Spx/MgsR family RNA polymerase-binding regulatory protein [Enterococcus faecium]MCD5113694.1 Spx/MgsR family RNA polymerase-binding regulatory protein [Enterococcus faecium]MCU4678522.1 Spx/MgsR family RNA polymerase-binding regulatory protein [Enterococcus faecium]MDK4440101.1 Spx/MgsR family RNA polymerase-binding regulatory protein [Enterococcus faecium]MDT2373821.1 Spx/MgsR family RNA polymerase-binding regulatory protein [Enterococcus faecium]MDW3693976.1 Spx/MgsR family RNA polymerase
MLTIYSSRTHSYHLMANWLKDHQMPYRERIFTPKQPLTRKEIFYLLSLTENGFDDLLAKRSIDYKNLKDQIDQCTTSELVDLIVSHFTLLQRPIITDGKKLLVGFNEDSMRLFIPVQWRRSQLKSVYNDFTWVSNLENSTDLDDEFLNYYTSFV